MLTAIAALIGEFLIWQFGEFGIENLSAPMEVSIQIAKFKLHHYQSRAISPSLMLTKVTHYTVYERFT